MEFTRKFHGLCHLCYNLHYMVYLLGKWKKIYIILHAKIDIQKIQVHIIKKNNHRNVLNTHVIFL